MFLQDLKSAEKKIRFSGVGGIQLIVDQGGISDGFFKSMLERRLGRMC